jgi:hypothetical protein
VPIIRDVYMTNPKVITPPNNRHKKTDLRRFIVIAKWYQWADSYFQLKALIYK